jgi:mycothiol S-conjugate amidase
MSRRLVPDETITTWVDVTDVLDAKWRALARHVTQISPTHAFLRFGVEGWREFWSREAYILRASRVSTVLPEADLFAGLG